MYDHNAYTSHMMRPTSHTMRRPCHSNNVQSCDHTMQHTHTTVDLTTTTVDTTQCDNTRHNTQQCTAQCTTMHNIVFTNRDAHEPPPTTPSAPRYATRPTRPHRQAQHSPTHSPRPTHSHTHAQHTSGIGGVGAARHRWVQPDPPTERFSPPAEPRGDIITPAESQAESAGQPVPPPANRDRTR